MKTSHKKPKAFLRVSLFLAFVITGGNATAGSMLEISFDQTLADNPGVTVVGGEFSPDGAGWSSNTRGDMVPRGDRVEFDLSETLPSNGYFEFTVERLRGKEGYGTKQSPYETVFELFDGNGHSLFVVHLSWERVINGESLTSLHFAGTEYGKVLNSAPFGNVALFKKMVPVGDSVTVRINYGPSADSNRVFIDGIEAQAYLIFSGSWISASRTGDLGKLFQDARLIRIGVEKSDEEVSYSPLYFSAIKSLKIGAPSVIQEISHDAFKMAGISGKMVTGDKLTVTLKGEPGGVASFDLGPIKGHPLEESPDNPGTYSGIHVIKVADDVEEGQLVGNYIDAAGLIAQQKIAERPVTIDTKIYLDVKPSNNLIPADEDSRSGITIVATDANGKAVRKHPLMLTMSTTDEYTGILGGINFEDAVGGQIEVDWGGVTDSFGEVTAQYISGFAAKTILVSAKDMMTGDVGVGWVRSYIDGAVDIIVKQPAARALAVQGSMEVSASRDWLTADGRSRSRITAVVRDPSGNPMEGNNISFNLLGNNGTIRVIKSRTDSRGRATADYISGTTIGQIQIEVRDLTSGLVALVSIELRPDAPAEVSLAADPGEVFIGDRKGSTITAKVTDINRNPNTNTDVLFEVMAGEGSVSSPKVATDDRDGIAEVMFLPGNKPGVATVKATVMSREPTAEEIEAAEGAVFLYGLVEDPGRLDVVEWLAEAGDDVVEGQELVTLEDRRGNTYTVKAPHEGTLATFTAEERDRVEYGQTLGYVLPVPE